MKTEIQLIPSRKDDNIGQLQLFQRIIQTLLILLVFDSIYLFITHKKYNVTKNPVNWYSAGISWFIIAYMLSIQLSNSLLESFVYGLVLGLAMYGVYNFVNYSIVSDYSFEIVVMDTIWGMTICSVTAMILYSINK